MNRSASVGSPQQLMNEARMQKGFERGKQALVKEQISSSKQARPRDVLSPDALKKRGMKAAALHKSSVDALLHPRHHGATPYRIILGDVSAIRGPGGHQAQHADHHGILLPRLDQILTFFAHFVWHVT